MNPQLKLWIDGDVGGYNVIKLPSYTRVTLLVLFKNIEHLINALNAEHIKHIRGCFAHQNFATRFQPMWLFPMRIFPGNKLTLTPEQMMIWKEATQQEAFSISTETLQAATRILRYNYDVSPEFYHPTMTYQLFHTEYCNYW